MSTFEPMSEAALHEIAGNCATETSVLSRVVATALHHLARAKAAEEARDLAIAERDEAYRQRGRATTILRAALGPVDGADTIEDLASIVRGQLFDLRTILGATDGEMLSDAAGRVARAVESTYPGPQVLREMFGAAEGQGVIPAARAVVAELARLREGRDDTILLIADALGCKAGDNVKAKARQMADELTRLREGRDGQLRAAKEDAERSRDAMRRMEAEHAGALAVARMDAAEAGPAQTFPIQHEVRIRHYGSGKAGAEISINGVITDPAFLALSGNEYARLALVVTRG